MIGFDVPEQHKDLKKTLLNQYHIFTGEAKPNVIRLLPSPGFGAGGSGSIYKRLTASPVACTGRSLKH